MSDSVPSAAGSALEELLEVSPQVDAAVVLERDGGRLVASAPASSDRVADRFAATCVQLVDAAEQSRRELGREPITQVEVATPDGHVFLVTDANWIVAAVTDADPTVGLVFYDLKTALRGVREAAQAGTSGGDGPAVGNGAAPVTVVSTDDLTADGDDEGEDTSATGGSAMASPASTSAGDEPSTEQAPRWRRRKS